MGALLTHGGKSSVEKLTLKANVVDNFSLFGCQRKLDHEDNKEWKEVVSQLDEPTVIRLGAE